MHGRIGAHSGDSSAVEASVVEATVEVSPSDAPVPIEIRPAVTTADLEAVFRLRYSIYVDEMGAHFPGAAVDHARRLLPDQPGRASRVLLAADRDDVIGTIKIDCGRDAPFTDEELAVYRLAQFAHVVPLDRMAVFSRFMTAPAYRSGDVPPRLIAAMIDHLLERGTRLLFCDCRPHLISSYERLGFRTYASVYNDDVAGILTPLILVFDDLAYLRQVRSRLVPQIEARPSDPAIGTRVAALLPAAAAVHSVEHVEQWRDWPDVAAVLGKHEDDHSIALFEDIDESEIARLIDLSHVIECHTGDKIVAQDAVDRTMFVVLDGVVEVSRGGQSVRVIGRGGVFGEIAFLLREARTADVVALSDDVRILALRERTLSDLVASRSDVAARLLLNLSRILARRVGQAG